MVADVLLATAAYKIAIFNKWYFRISVHFPFCNFKTAALENLAMFCSLKRPNHSVKKWSETVTFNVDLEMWFSPRLVS